MGDDPPYRVEVVPACAVHGVGMGFLFVVGCVGLFWLWCWFLECSGGWWRDWGWICRIGLVWVSLKSCFGAIMQRFGCVWCR